MKKQIIHTLALISALLVGNQTLAYSWYLQNEAGYAINGDVSLIGCGRYTDLGWKSVPTGSQQQWLGTGGVSGCTGRLLIDDYAKASNLGNVSIPGTVSGYSVLYCGYYPTNDQATLNGSATYTPQELSQVIGVNIENLQVFPNWSGITWAQSGGKCPAPAN